MKRRQVVTATGSLVGGAAAAAVVDHATRRISRSDTGTQTPLTPIATATAASPSGEDTAQYKGGPLNKGHQPSTLSPTGIQNKDKKFEDLKFTKSPIINPDGKAFAVDADDGKIAVYDIENQQEINTINTAGALNHGMWHNGNIVIGNSAGTHKINPETGNTIKSIEEDSRAFIIKRNGMGYGGRAFGIADYPLDTLDSQTNHESINDAFPGGMTIQENGILAGIQSNSPLISYDTENKEIIHRNDTENSRLPYTSSDGDHLFTIEQNPISIGAWEIPKNTGETFQLIDKSSLNSGTKTPTVVDDTGEDTWLYNGTFYDDDNGDFHLQGYTFDGNSITQEWDVTRGKVGEVIKHGDTVIASGSGLTGHHAETGELLFQENSIDGWSAMPYQDKILVGDQGGGLWIAEMETEDISNGGSPDLDLSFTGLPTDPVAQGSTVKFDFTIVNSGDAEFTGDIAFEYSAGDADETFSDALSATVPAEETLDIRHEYTPAVYADSSFAFAYDPGTETVTVTVPVEIDGDQTETTITGNRTEADATVE